MQFVYSSDKRLLPLYHHSGIVFYAISLIEGELLDLYKDSYNVVHYEMDLVAHKRVLRT